MNQIYFPLKIQECTQKRSYKKSHTQNFLRVRYLNRKEEGGGRKGQKEMEREVGRQENYVCQDKCICND